MSEVQNNSLQYFVVIAEQKKKDKFISLLSDHSAHCIETVYAHGSVGKSALASAFGFEIEQHKVLITCLIKKDNAQALLNTLYEDYNFKKPNTGIAYSIAVEGLAL
ncbi:MAG: hypothetical protein IKA77_05290 [Clostridia bacterium]|nr:hypothetical protein [Clostridia bacterium]